MVTVDVKTAKIAVVGLGYVGLPLAVAFGKTHPVVGYDINEQRIINLKQGHDNTLEVEKSELLSAKYLSFTNEPRELSACNVFIVTVPTPIDNHKRPDLHPLVAASEMLAPMLKIGDVVIYESTVYPGVTEEVCVPILVAKSGLEFNKDFFVGYSPERINPGDKQRRLTSIVKITSGSTAAVADFVDSLYASIVSAGTHKAASIRVAEAAKVIENTQRDLNIALVNELAIIFNKMQIDTEAVLNAAGTKWNFLPFRPGLVGGHCIGVDPYYLTYKAEEIGYHPQVILAGRRINDSMGQYVASQLVKAMLRRRIHIVGSRVLVLGLAFKENCPDLRNTRVVDLVSELREYGASVDVCDPRVDANEAKREYGLSLIEYPSNGQYDGIIVAVAHSEFVSMGASVLRSFGKQEHVLYDIKHILGPEESDLRL